jgi:hypothetical protein
MKRLTIILVFGFQYFVYGQTLTGQVFMIADSFSDDKCEVAPECDCCSSDLYFLTKDKFCFVAQCISGDTYYTGTYSIDSNKLRLIFDNKYLDEITDDDYNIVGLEIKEKTSDPLQFQINNCGQKIKLTGVDCCYGSRYDQKRETELKKRLLNSKPWKEISK